MQKSILFLFLWGLTLTYVNEGWWAAQEPKIVKFYLKKLTQSDQKIQNNEEAAEIAAKNSAIARKKATMIHSFLSKFRYSFCEFQEMLGVGSFGMVFLGRKMTLFGKEKISVKLIWERSDKFRRSTSAENNYQALQKAGVPYLIRSESPIHYKDTQTPPLYLSGIEMEFANPVTKPMFAPTYSYAEKATNTGLILKFIDRLLEAFAWMHFKASYYHADVKPDNLMWVDVNGSIEPRIIDFDLSFRKESPGFNPKWLIYTPGFRPPELCNIVKDNSPTEEQTAELNAYQYDDEFREESWAVGQTAKEILATNSLMIAIEDPRIVQLKEILKEMTREEIASRISTNQAWKMLKDIIKVAKAGAIKVV